MSSLTPLFTLPIPPKKETERKIMRPNLLIISILSAFAFGACADDGASNSGNDSSRADRLCETDADIIQRAKDELLALNPFYEEDDFSNGTIEAIEDLNGDGTDDMLVKPGLRWAGANVETTVFFSGCPAQFAGSLGSATEVVVTKAKSSTYDVLDLESTNVSGCEAEISPYHFDGEGYLLVVEQVRTEDACSSEAADWCETEYEACLYDSGAHEVWDGLGPMPPAPNAAAEDCIQEVASKAELEGRATCDWTYLVNTDKPTPTCFITPASRGESPIPGLCVTERQCEGADASIYAGYCPGPNDVKCCSGDGVPGPDFTWPENI